MKNFFTMSIIALFGVLILNISKADEMRICTMEYRPVCGTNGVTYGNACGAGSQPIAYEGECKEKTPSEPIACTKEYMPVCGSKQVQCIQAPCPPIEQTYGNSCMMKADNAILAYKGECSSKTSSQYQKLTIVLDTIVSKRNITTSEAKKAFVQDLIEKINYTMMVSLMTPRQNALWVMLKDFLEYYLETL